MDTWMHAWILNKLLSINNESQYDLNYTIMYYIEYKYVKRNVTSYVQAIIW